MWKAVTAVQTTTQMTVGKKESKVRDVVTSRAKTAGPIMGRKPRIVRKQRGLNRSEENLGRVELSSRVQQDRGKVYEENEIPN